MEAGGQFKAVLFLKRNQTTVKTIHQQSGRRDPVSTELILSSLASMVSSLLLFLTMKVIGKINCIYGTDLVIITIDAIDNIPGSIMTTDSAIVANYLYQ